MPKNRWDVFVFTIPGFLCKKATGNRKGDPIKGLANIR